jgi:hypothetical protein
MGGQQDDTSHAWNPDRATIIEKSADVRLRLNVRQETQHECGDASHATVSNQLPTMSTSFFSASTTVKHESTAHTEKCKSIRNIKIEEAKAVDCEGRARTSWTAILIQDTDIVACHWRVVFAGIMVCIPPESTPQQCHRQHRSARDVI